MRRPRPLTGAALAAFTVAATVAGLGAVPAAFADTASASDLYVSNSSACSDTGPGTRAAPFCTIQAAANLVEPGQTVHVAPASTTSWYEQPVTLTRSGTPSAPITFTGDVDSAGAPTAGISTAAGSVPLTLSGVHDVHVDSLTLSTATANLVNVTGSQDIVLDRLTTSTSDPDDTSYDGVHIDGASSGVTMSRSHITAVSGYAVRAEQGAHDVTVTTDDFGWPRRGGVLLDGTAGADVVGDTVEAVCGPAITLQNGTSGVIENNVLVGAPVGVSPYCPAPDSGMVTVDTASAGGVTADYNTFSDEDTDFRPAYSWAGAPYATPDARTAATGAGSHDALTTDQLSTTSAPGPAGGAIDSADADAPGELSTDIEGVPHVDDTAIPNTGTGPVSYADRGAFENHDLITVPADESASPANGTVPFTTSVPVGDATSSWHEPLTYCVDFGDGSAPVTGTGANPPQHTYTTPGAYTETVTVTDTDGVTRTRTTKVVAATDDPPPASLSAALADSPPAIRTGLVAFNHPETDAFEVASRVLTFGDGLSADVTSGTSTTHLYLKPGDYPAKLTVTDVLGRSSTATAPFRVTASYVLNTGLTPLSHTIPAHSVWTIPASSIGDGNMSAVELRVNARSSTDGGWLTAYPAGTTRPSASTLNFPAGGGASNQETVAPGSSGDIAVYNGAASSVNVTVQNVGAMATVESAGSYHPTSPTTLVDTRYGTGGVSDPVGAGKSLTVQVAGTHGVPTNATAVALDVAENTTKASGSLGVAPHGTTSPAVTSSYWRAGESVTNLVTVPLTDGKVTLTNNSTGSANLIAALAGWYSVDTTGSGAWPVTPVRVLNTQTGLGEPGDTAVELAAHGTLKVKVAGTAGLPATGLTAADLNLTVSAPTASGWLVAYPDGTTRPTAGALNYTKGHTIAGQALIKVGTDGYIDLYNPTNTAINVFADIHGGYVPMS